MKSRTLKLYSIKSVFIIIIIFVVIIIANVIDFRNFAFRVTYIIVFIETKIFLITVSYCYNFFKKRLEDFIYRIF